MTSQRSVRIKTLILSTLALSFAALTLVTFAVPAQQPGAAQTSAALLPAPASIPAQAVAPALPPAGNTARVAASGLRANSLHARVVTLASSLSFLPAVSYDPGGSGEAGDFRTIAVADVNGDGNPDIVVSNFWSSTVGVLLGNGDGTFQTAMTFTPGVQNSAIAIADVNGDGKPDLIVGIWSGGVGVLLGNGDGTFQQAVSYGSGVYAWSVAVADVNGDANPDLVVAGGLFGGAAVVLGNGDGTFKPAVSYSWSGEWAQSIAVADVNHDNKPDLLVAVCETTGCDHGAAAVLLGNGDGTFQAAVDYDSGGAGANGIAVADVDGDGKPDLLVANWVTSSVGVLLGNGDGTFQTSVTYGSGGLYPMSILAADLNGDGKPDLIVGNECDPSGSCISGIAGVLLNNTGSQSTTATTLTSSQNPSTHGQPITFTATVTTSGPVAPTGTVNFKWGPDGMGTGTLNASGVATFTTSILKPGPYKITAVYKGDASNLTSTSAVLHQGVKY